MAERVFFGNDGIYTDFRIGDIKIFAATIEACKICVQVCLSTKNCLAANLCLECAEIGEVLIRFQCCRARLTDEIARLFAQICELCKNECAKLNFSEANNLTHLCEMCLIRIEEHYKKKCISSHKG